FQTNERKFQAAGLENLPLFIRGSKVNSFDGGENVYAIRWPPHLNGVTGLGKIARLEQFSEAKVFDSLFDAGGIVRICRHPDIEVCGKSRIAVERHRVTADNQEFNPM